MPGQLSLGEPLEQLLCTFSDCQELGIVLRSSGSSCSGFDGDSPATLSSFILLDQSPANYLWSRPVGFFASIRDGLTVYCAPHVLVGANLHTCGIAAMTDIGGRQRRIGRERSRLMTDMPQSPRNGLSERKEGLRGRVARRGTRAQGLRTDVPSTSPPANPAYRQGPFSNEA
jgi:hypothetical protein